MIGISEINVNGVKRGFKFGTYQLSIACDLENCSLGELGDRLQRKDGNNVKTILNVLYAASVSYCKSNRIEVDFEVFDVADWMDEIGLEDAMSLINTGLKAPVTSVTKGKQGKEKKSSRLKVA